MHPLILLILLATGTFVAAMLVIDALADRAVRRQVGTTEREIRGHVADGTLSSRDATRLRGVRTEARPDRISRIIDAERTARAPEPRPDQRLSGHQCRHTPSQET